MKTLTEWRAHLAERIADGEVALMFSDMPAEIYHADPLPVPSLSAGGIPDLIEECPAMFWWNNRRLNPEWEATESTTFDIGKAAHLVFLEPHLFEASTAIIKADDYKGGEAKKARDIARLEGKIPLLFKQAETIRTMHTALMGDETAHNAFTGPGKAEVSIFWRDAQTGVWCRCRPDWTPDHYRWLVDYKTDTSANPANFGKKSFEQSYYQRAAWYLEGFQAVTGVMPERYWFVVQAKKKPFLASVIDLDFYALDVGREECRRAREIFGRCLAKGTDRSAWPGYRRPEAPDRPSAFTVGMPQYAYYRIQERAEAAVSRAPQRAARRVAETYQAPGE